MRDELEFDGFWEGMTPYRCDGCGKVVKFRFDGKDDAFDSKSHRASLHEKGWMTTKVNGQWRDFCCESCRNKYIRSNTL
mgnify:CR=1 FL=1